MGSVLFSGSYIVVTEMLFFPVELIKCWVLQRGGKLVLHEAAGMSLSVQPSRGP